MHSITGDLARFTKDGRSLVTSGWGIHFGLLFLTLSLYIERARVMRATMQITLSYNLVTAEDDDESIRRATTKHTSNDEYTSGNKAHER